LDDDQVGGWVNVSSGTGSPEYSRPGQRAAKQLLLLTTLESMSKELNVLYFTEFLTKENNDYLSSRMICRQEFLAFENNHIQAFRAGNFCQSCCLQ